MQTLLAKRIPSLVLLGLLGLGCLVAACGGDATPEPMTPPSGANAPVAQTSMLSAPAPTAVSGPKQVTCKLEAAHWNGNPLKLRTSVDAAPFLVVGQGAAVAVSLGATRAEGLYVEVERGAVKAHGYVEAAELPLYAAAPAELKGFAIPTPNAELTFLKGSPDSVYYDFNLDSKRARPSQGSDKNTKSCAFFSLEKKDFNPLSVSGSSTQKSVAIKPGHYDLLGDADGPAVGSIDVDDKTGYAALLGKSGRKVRVAYPVGDVMVVGWIDALKVVEQRETIKTPSTTVVAPVKSGASERNTGVATWKKVKCPSEVKLFADVGGTRFVVGRVRSTETVQLGPVQGSVRGVAFPEVDMMAADTAKLFVDANEAGTCQ